MEANNSDTRKLLRECHAGIKMGIASLDDVMNSVSEYSLERRIKDSKRAHERLRIETEEQLNNIRDKGKNPNPMAKTMSHIKTKAVTAADKTDHAVAKLVIKGCDMGVKSLNRYMDKYAAADESGKALAGRIIAEEQGLRNDLEQYL